MPKNATRYYFAYGSNMNHEQMKKRCPNSRFIKSAYIKGYKFVYDGYSTKWEGAVANIISDKHSIVWGGLFEIDDSCLTNLDRCEGYPKVYNREILKFKDREGNKNEAWVYFREPQQEGEPLDTYVSTILEGARASELPEEYIKKIIVNRR
jgi:gamma-glutamylcyclotransferase